MDNLVNLYSINDTAANRFGPLFEAVNDQVAARSYLKIVEKVEKQFRGEYVLYRIGQFDSLTGMIISETIPEKVVVSYNFTEV